MNATNHYSIIIWSGRINTGFPANISHYHPSTNRWEIPNPIENTYIPFGGNFNSRPLIKSKCSYDFKLNKLLYINNSDLNDLWQYDAEIGDWLPNGFSQKNSKENNLQSFKLYSTPSETFALSNTEKVFKYNYIENKFNEMPIKTTGLIKNNPVSSEFVYDSKRNRFLWLRRSTWQLANNSDLFEVNLKTFELIHLKPLTIKPTLSNIEFSFKGSAYDSNNDIVLVPILIADSGQYANQLIMYKCANNRWLGVNFEGPNLLGKPFSGSILGLVFDSRRSLIWAVKCDLNVMVLRIDLKAAKISYIDE